MQVVYYINTFFETYSKLFFEIKFSQTKRSVLKGLFDKRQLKTTTLCCDD